MDFTREPIIESVITPKDGCKIVVRSSKNSGQEEFFVDAVEVVSFGNCFFFRSLERPKAFLVPVSDYEILEVRETRMVLKNVGIDQSIKIGGGKEQKQVKEPPQEKTKIPESVPLEPEEKIEKKRDRRKHFKRRRGSEEAAKEIDLILPQEETATTGKVELPKPKEVGEESVLAPPVTRSSPLFATLLPPPPNLISETLARLKDDDLFKDVFSNKELLEDESTLEIGEETTTIPETERSDFSHDIIEKSEGEQELFPISTHVEEEEASFLQEMSHFPVEPYVSETAETDKDKEQY